MSQASDRAEAVRGKTLAALTALLEQGKAADLPAPPPALEVCRRKLQDNTYQVLVVGEAKRGKSTFVNALIGRPLLPTDVDVATRQVFRICPADLEAYRVRYEDDTEKSIAASDLASYGSQVVADREGVPRLDEMVRWIEVDVPVRFLPANVRLLDTPGLGALYAAHAQITYRFVPHADAVLFVLESQAPVSAPEIRFIEDVLEVTHNLFFVQTKIDQFRREAWQEIQKRNQDVLKQRFADRIPDTRVWPFSSTNLAKVAATNDEDYLQVSRYPELAAALQAFLFRVTGWDRAAAAGVLAQEYHAQGHSILARRLAALTDEAGAQIDEAQRAARRTQFAADWSETGPRYLEARAQAREAANAAKRSFSQILQPGSSLEIEHRERIDRLQSVAEASDYAANISGHIVAAVSKRWQGAAGQFQAACAEALGPLWQAGRQLEDATATPSTLLPMRSGPGFDVGGSYYRRTKAAMSEFTTAATVASSAAITFAYVASVAFPPFAVAGIVLTVLGVGVAGALSGWREVAGRELRAARLELHKHLNAVLTQVRLHFLGDGAAGLHHSLVDDYLRKSLRELSQQASQLTQRKLAEMDAETVRLQENARLEGERRQAKIEETRRHLREWESLTAQLKEVQAELQNLERTWQPG